MYEINRIFGAMELELVQSYNRNMRRHSKQEIKHGFKWDMWQAQKLRDLQQYRAEATLITAKHSKKAKWFSAKSITSTYNQGLDRTEAIIKQFSLGMASSSFSGVNARKLDVLINSIHNDIDNAGRSTLRLVDDQFRKIIFKTQAMFNSGAVTLPKAIDMAAKDFLSQGINSIQYRNGANVNIASYAEMVLRTSNKKAYLTAEGAKQDEWGEYLTQVTSYGGCSPICLPWQGKVYINDVYASGKPDGEHQLLSVAMAEGLFHPNCRHTTQPYFEGISSLPTLNKTPEEIQKTYEAEQKQRAIERKIREYKRVSEGSLDEANKTKADKKIAEWQERMRQHLKENTFLSRKADRESTFGIPASIHTSSVKPKKFKITDSMRNSIREYSSGSYNGINNYLRTGRAIRPEVLNPIIHNIDTAIDLGSDIQAGTTLFRGTNLEGVLSSMSDVSVSPNLKITDSNVELLKRKMVGKTYMDKAYTSTSKDSVIDHYVGNVEMRINTTKAAKGLDISNISQVGVEREVLLKRNAQMKITDVTKEKGKFVVHLIY